MSHTFTSRLSVMHAFLYNVLMVSMLVNDFFISNVVYKACVVEIARRELKVGI